MKEKEDKIQIDPKYKEKKDTLAELKSELAKLIGDRDILEKTVKKNLEALYKSSSAIFAPSASLLNAFFSFSKEYSLKFSSIQYFSCF